VGTFAAAFFVFWLFATVPLLAEQRLFNAWPVVKISPANFNVWNFAGRSPIKKRPSANW
jgi:hypothetical protein